MKESFIVTQVSREDLETIGYDTSKVSDDSYVEHWMLCWEYGYLSHLDKKGTGYARAFYKE